MADSLASLAELLQEYNRIGSQIAALIGRPAQIGHVGEYIASQIFDIRLERSARTKSIDGHFTTGPLAGSSVNVKWYLKQEGILDMVVHECPDYYLVLAGPREAPMTSRGGTRPWLIRSVFLFAGAALHETVALRGVKVGIATSVRVADWEAAMIYPHSRNPAYVLSDWQRQQLALFA